MRIFSKFKSLSPQHWTWSTRGLVAAGALFGIVILLILFTTLGKAGQKNGGSPFGQPSATSEHPTPTPTSSVDRNAEATNGSDEIEYPTGPNCLITLGASAYQTFEDSVIAYEQAYLSTPSPERDGVLGRLTTVQYQSDHRSNAPQDEGSTTIVRIIRNKTAVSCAVESDGATRQVSIIATIETSSINSSGEKKIIFPELKLAIPHYSTWVTDSSAWKVDKEQ